MNPFKSETQEFTRAGSELKDASRPLLLCLYIVYLFIFLTWKISHIFLFVWGGTYKSACVVVRGKFIGIWVIGIKLSFSGLATRDAIH